MLKKNSDRLRRTILVLAVVIAGLLAGVSQATAQGLQRDENEDKTIYKVVINHEDQYSIWPGNRENPLGWRDVGKTRNKEECLDYIKEIRRDNRPLSLRQRSEEDRKKTEEDLKKAEQDAEMEKNPSPPPSAAAPNNPTEESLVEKLSAGDHTVEFGVSSERRVKLFKEAIDHNLMLIRFTDIEGKPALRIELDKESSKFDDADFENSQGTVHLEGTLTLAKQKMRFIGDIDLATLAGKGHLVKDEDAAKPEAESKETP